MANVPKWLKEPVREYAGATRQPYSPGNELSRLRWVKDAFEVSQPIFDQADALRTSDDTDSTLGEGRRRSRGRPPKFKRSQLLKLAMLPNLLGCDLITACRIAQSSDQLRQLLGIPLLTAETMTRLEQADTDEEVTEPDFPSRQLIDNFIHQWLSRYGKDLVWLEEFAYLELPYLILVETACDYSVVAVDSTEVLSAVKRPNAKRADEGASFVGKDDKPKNLGRYKHTIIAAKDLPVILAGQCISTSEQTWQTTRGIPTLAARASEMERRLQGTGLNRLTAHEGLVTGDGLFRNNPMMKVLYDNGLEGAFRIKGLPGRTIEYTYVRTGFDRAGNPFEITLEIANDGTVYCPCDKRRPIEDREPMRKYVGKRGHNGHIYVACARTVCARQGLKLFVPFSACRNSDGEVDLRILSSVDRADKRIEAILHKGCNAVEHSHTLQHEFQGLNPSDRRNGRLLNNETSHRFAYLIGDLVWNITILVNVRRDRAQRTALETETLFDASIRKTRTVQENTAKKKKAKTTSKKQKEQNTADKSHEESTQSLPLMARFHPTTPEEAAARSLSYTRDTDPNPTDPDAVELAA